MGFLAVLRRFRLPGIFLLLGLWSFTPLTGILGEAWEHLHPTEVASALIEIESPAPERCHHHPEGCPKDCFCPKITDEASHSHEEPAEAPAATLAEPMLVQCTEGTPDDRPPALLALWPVVTPMLPLVALSSDLSLPVSSSLPRDPFQDPPFQVPRS